MTPHAPRYIYCPDPDLCCETYGPVSIVCAVDGEQWPCQVKRSHHTDAQAAKIERWANGRRGRLAEVTA